MKTLAIQKNELGFILEVWFKNDKSKLISKLEKGLEKAKKENNLKLVRLLIEDLKILSEV